MESTNTLRTFTITQARIGEPLQFRPALGSKELDELVDAYVLGAAPKQDKLSEVTLEFFNLAQVDIYTGLLTRHYSVAVPSPTWASLTSPLESQSSGFSPPIFTPSPASSMTFADSGYGSISMTPPTRNTGAPNRVVKKAKKDSKKAAETRLPGFSIMTKDGVDVTSSAGRGTKTKEQREHAHLMRIMKACADCKRKKVRCDPSHRRSATDMSRSTSSSSSRPNTSPPSSSRKTTLASTPELPSFGNNPIDDFVLFPEDNTASWNSADFSIPEFDENLDLSQFNFDISGIDDSNPGFDFFDQYDLLAPSGSSGHRDPFVADFNQWELSQDSSAVCHTRPHHSLSSQDSGQLDSSFFDSGYQSNESQGVSPSSSNVSPHGGSVPSAEIFWSHDHNLIASLDAEAAELAPLNRRERRIADRARNATIRQLVDSIPSESLRQGQSQESSLDSLFEDSQCQSPGATSGGSLEYWGLENTRALVNEATAALKSTPAAYQPIYEELQRLRGVLEAFRSGDTERTSVLRQAMLSEIEMLTSQLQVLFSRIKKMLRTNRVINDHQHDRLDPDRLSETLLRGYALQTHRLVSALCATISNLETQDCDRSAAIAATSSPTLIVGDNQDKSSTASDLQSHPQDRRSLVSANYSSLSSSGNSLSSLRKEMISSEFQQYIDNSTLSDHRTKIHDGDILSLNSGGANSLEGVAIATRGETGFRLIAKPAHERLLSLVDTQATIHHAPEALSTAQHDKELTNNVHNDQNVSSRNTQFAIPRTQQHQHVAMVTHANLACPLITINPLLAAVPRILVDRASISLQHASDTPATTHQSIGSSRRPQTYSGSSSPGAIPGSASDQTAALISDTVVNYMLMLASLILLNYLQASAFRLPLATILLAVPRPAPAIIVATTLAFVLAQSISPSTVLAGMRCFFFVGILSAKLLKQSSNGPSGRVLSSFKKFSSPFATSKDTTLRSMFRDLSIDQRMATV